jgi:hypothetical protein
MQRGKKLRAKPKFKIRRRHRNPLAPKDGPLVGLGVPVIEVKGFEGIIELLSLLPPIRFVP